MGALSIFKRAALLLLSVPFWFLGLLFFISSFDPAAASQGKAGSRIVIGVLMLLAGLIFTIFAFIPTSKSREDKAREEALSKQEAPGELNVKKIKCSSCGADLDPASATLSAEGTMSYSCPYCGGTFLLEEAPKW
jgi:DNA-directed RNA polymerase subunit RPC12/RpoP